MSNQLNSKDIIACTSRESRDAALASLLNEAFGCDEAGTLDFDREICGSDFVESACRVFSELREEAFNRRSTSSHSEIAFVSFGIFKDGFTESGSVKFSR